VSAKCCPSCRDGATEPARGARCGTRAPPGRWLGGPWPGKGNGLGSGSARDPSLKSSLPGRRIPLARVPGAGHLLEPAPGLGKYAQHGPPWAPSSSHESRTVWSVGSWDPALASSLDRRRVCTPGARRAPLPRDCPEADGGERGRSPPNLLLLPYLGAILHWSQK
jgi:hypothetical protein